MPTRSHRQRRTRPVALALVAALALAGATCAQPIHDRVYQPPKAALTAATTPEGFSLIQVKTADGLTLSGLERAPQPGRPTLLILHGNATAATGAAEWLRPLAKAGYGLVVAEFRGYSANPGRPSEAGLAEDADAFHAEARRLAGSGRLIVLGHSLGAAVGFGLARRRPVDALVSLGAFTRLRDMAPAIARPFITERYDNLAAIAAVRTPVFLIHGAADKVAPLTAARDLHAAAHYAHTPGLTFIIAGADHHPRGELVAAILKVVLARLEDPTAAVPPLPPEVRVYERQ